MSVFVLVFFAGDGKLKSLFQRRHERNNIRERARDGRMERERERERGRELEEQTGGERQRSRTLGAKRRLGLKCVFEHIRSNSQ